MLGWVKNFFALWCNGLTVEKVDVIGFGGQIGDFLLDNENCISLFYRSIQGHPGQSVLTSNQYLNKFWWIQKNVMAFSMFPTW